MIKYCINLFASFVIILMVNNCDVVDGNEITGSGNLVTVEQNFSNFNQIKTGFAFESIITRDSEFSVFVTIDDNLEKYLNVYQLNNILYIQMEDNDYQDAELRVEITMPDIEKLDLSGASASQINGFNLDHDLEIILSGASTLSGNFHLVDLTLRLSGASNVQVQGTGTNLIANASGASVIDLGGFPFAEDADITLSGASVSTLRLLGTLDADLSGASVLNYHGEPTLGVIQLTGASTIQKVP